MALANYTDLQASIAAWTKRSDLAAVIPDFIRLTETRLNRDLTMRQAELEVTLAGVIGSRFIPLPTDYATPVGVYDTTYEPRNALTQVSADQLEVKTSRGQPQFWCVDGTNIAFELPCELAYPYRFRYVKDYALSDANPTNDILTSHPDLYLFGALTEAALYMFDDQRAQFWNGKYQAALESANNTEVKAFKDVPLRCDDMSARKTYNIYQGY